MSSSIKRHWYLRAVVAAATFIAAIGTSQLMHAQNPTPAPSPSPAPSPPPFHSPFPKGPGAGPGAGEEAAFNNLVTLYDQELDAQDALRAAKACGTHEDIEAANAALAKAQSAFNAAINQYIFDYSNNLYTGGVPQRNTPARRAYEDDALKVQLAVVSASKHKHKYPWCPTGTAMIKKNFGHVQTTETLATSDVVTNEFDDSGDPIGFGIGLGAHIGRSLLNHPIIVGPFVSLDFMTQTINHTFSGTSFLGTTTHWNAMAGAKVGEVTRRGVFVYGLGGVGLLHQDLNINFGQGLTSSSTSTAGFMLGGGAEFHPDALHVKQKPLGLFVQYEHTTRQNATLKTPKASPNFNFAFARSDDTFKVGVDVRLRK